MARYRVNAGIHQERVQVPNPDKPGEQGGWTVKTYNTGDVFETDEDMLRYNGAGMTPKFIKLEDNGRTRRAPALDPNNPPEGWVYVGGGSVPYGETSAPPAPANAPVEDHRPLSKLPPEAVVASVPEALRGPEQGQPHDTTQNMPSSLDARPPHTPQPNPPRRQSAVPPRSDVRGYSAALDKMTDQELRDYAADEEIDLKGAKNRADAIKVLKAQK